ncbi:MAG: Gfo/Idh/MocA family protein [Pyrinomonadaceae bacterium]
MDEQGRMRIGVCGVGSIGSRHARLLAQRGDVDLYVADNVEAHIREIQKFATVAASTASFEQMLEFGLDGVIVATPDHLHVPFAEAACRHGVPVLLEKPIAETAAIAERLLAVSDETGTQILVGYPLRHNAIFLRAKEILDQGQIGLPVSFQVELGAYETLVVAKNRFKPGDQNKIFVDYSHEWDYIQWFLGKAKRVVGSSHTLGGREKKQEPNVVNALLQLESGVSGTVHLDYIQTPGKRVFGIVGDAGAMTVDASRRSIFLQRYSDEFEMTYTLAETFDSMMARQLDHFLGVVAGREECRVVVEDGINALRVADALILSAETSSWQLIK